MAIFIRYPKDAQTSQPIKFDLDGVVTDVHRDTSVPANSTPLPVAVVDGSGVIVGFATEATLSAINTKTPALVSGRVPVDGSGVTQPVSAASLPLPTGASTSANQATANASLSSIDSKLTSPLTVTGPLTDTQLRASAVPVSVASLPLPSGAATEATLASIDGKIPSNLTVTSTRLLVDPSGVTSPVSIASLPLPTGAATSANQATEIASLSSIDGKLPSTLGQKAMTASLAVVIASDQSAIPASQSGTWNINDISGTISLPTGAATSALQTTGNTSLSSLDTKAVQQALNYGVATGAVRTASQIGNASGIADFGTGSAGAQTLRVVQASGTNPPPASGRSVVTTVRNDYSSTNVTTGSWVQLVASTSGQVNLLDIFDSSGQTLEIGTGAASSETRLIIIPPGGNGQIPVQIASGTRISVRAISATANSGELDINLLA